ncbi:MAG TPA: S8 family serine peptidase [Saprospiraceae bacterium]|nr:S8 family serine peptidase [Saprospiraceae bacterium]
MMRFLIVTLLVWNLFISNGQLLAQEIGDTSQYEFFVQLEEGTSDDTIEEYLEDLNSTEVWSHGSSGLAVWKVTSFPFTLSNGDQVLNINDVIRQSVRKTKITESNYNLLTGVVDSTDTPTGSCFDPLIFSKAQGTQRAVKISILDTGIDPNLSASSTPTLNYNLTNYTGFDYINNDDIPEDEHGHGSHIVGIIHSITHAISPNESYIEFDIRKTHNALGQGMMSNVVKALLDAVDNSSNIVNMSFGLSDTFSLENFYPLRVAIQHALNHNVLIITASGNDNKNIDILDNTTLPAVFPDGNIISVAALDCNDNKSTFSNYGAENVDIGVLGVLIPGPDSEGGIRYASGTSQSSGIVTAVAALLASYQNNFDPSILKCAILNGYSSVDTLNGQLLKDGKININTSLPIYQNLENTYTVSNSNDTGIGSLRYGLEKVCGVDAIIFDQSTDGHVINLLNKSLFLDRPISFTGNSQNQTLINGVNLPPLIIGYNGNWIAKNLTISKSGTATSTLINNGKISIEHNVKIK